jgi:hypothetical protein
MVRARRAPTVTDERMTASAAKAASPNSKEIAIASIGRPFPMSQRTGESRLTFLS